MVLQDVESPSDSGFVEAPPTTDADPYANGSSDTFTPRGSINFNPPGAPPAIVDLAPHTNAFVLPAERLWQLVERLSAGTVKTLGRPARQDEAEAVVEYAARVAQQRNYATLVGDGLAVGAYLVTRKSFLFPGWQPGESFNKEALGPLRGRYARFAWKAARFSAWYAAGTLVSMAATTAYGVSVLGPAYMRDPRMQDIIAAMRERNRQKAIKRENDLTPGPRSNETFEMARQRSAFQTASRERSNRSPSTSDEDDMSPTSGAFARDVSHYGSSRDAMTGVNDRSRESHSENRIEQQSRSEGTSKRPSSQDSAWDKLRQQALLQPDSSRHDASRAPSSTSNTSGLDQAFPLDYNQESSKAEAQREFDEQVERERRGGDFNEKPTGRRG